MWDNDASLWNLTEIQRLYFPGAKLCHTMWPGTVPAVLYTYKSLQFSPGAGNELVSTRNPQWRARRRWIPPPPPHPRLAHGCWIKLALLRLRTPTHICTICFVAQRESLPLPDHSHTHTHTPSSSTSSSSSRPHLHTHTLLTVTHTPWIVSTFKCQTTFHLPAASHMHRGSERDTDMPY